MARGRVRERDRGWARIRKAVKAADGAGVKVGVLAAAGNHDQDDGGVQPVTVAQVASWNEFGAGLKKDGTKRIPERPAFRQAIDGAREELRTEIVGAAVEVLLGEKVPRALGSVGLMAQALIRAKITALRDPPNAEITKERKGSSNPLIDTGQLRGSVTWEVVTGPAARAARRQRAV